MCALLIDALVPEYRSVYISDVLVEGFHSICPIIMYELFHALIQVLYNLPGLETHRKSA